MKALKIAVPVLMIVGTFAAWRFSGVGVDAPAKVTVVDAGPVRFLKGQTHAHSNKSGDSQTPPDVVGRWYSEHGFDFVVLTDHNFVTQQAAVNGTLMIPGVELTQNLETCEPPPPPGMGCLLHVNALFVEPTRAAAMGAAKEATRLGLFTRALKTTEAMNGLAQLNHPNFQYAADAKTLAELTRRGATFLEVANQASDSNNSGDATHPNTEALWDAVLSEGLTIYGTATDDAHHYDDAETAKPAFPGDLGFVMVRAKKVAASIRDAMARGDFYASTGVLFRKLEVTPTEIVIETDADADFRCVGQGGKILSQQYGRQARCGVPAEGYVRAVATNSAGKKAWSQPVRAATMPP